MDLNHKQLMKEVSGSLKVKYLSPYKNKNNSTTATGILFGPNARPISHFSLPVAQLDKEEQITIHFLIDTGPPNTYIFE